MKYDGIRKRLLRKYRTVSENGTTYFMDSSDMVVATENSNHNLLVMYVSSCKQVRCHHGIVAIAIAKDFMLIKKYEVSVADVVVMNGLCGVNTTLQRTSNMLLECIASEDICYKGRYPSDVEQRYIEAKKIIGTMGYMEDTTKAILYIGISIEIPIVFYYPREKSFDFNHLIYGVLSYAPTSRMAMKTGHKHKIQPKDYTVYEYLRNKYSHFWELRTVGDLYRCRSIDLIKDGTNYHEAVKAIIREV